MSYTLVKGIGDYKQGEACIMSAAVAKYCGEPVDVVTDKLECVCPVVRAFAIHINDTYPFENDEERTRVLTPYIDKIIGTARPDGCKNRGTLLGNWIIKSLGLQRKPGDFSQTDDSPVNCLFHAVRSVVEGRYCFAYAPPLVSSVYDLYFVRADASLEGLLALFEEVINCT